MLLQRNNIVAVLDIGSSKVVCLIAKLQTDGQLEVLGTGYHIAQGIWAGIITDIEAAENSIIQTVEAAELAAGERVKKIYVSISSNILLSQKITSDMNIVGREINYKDLNKLLLEMLNHYQKQPIEIIHSFVYDYMLDGNSGIVSPIGLYGNNLTCYTHVLSSPINTLLNITNCIAKCGLVVENYISSAYASGLACLSPDEMKLGVTLIEFGGGNTSISIFENGQLVFTDGIPLGGINVTNDIAKGLCTSFANAERIKNLFGGTVITTNDSSEVIEVPIGDLENNEVNMVSRALLIEIIRARIEEIIELIAVKLNGSGNQLNNKIVITGGSASIQGLKELVSHIFSTKVRLATPKSLLGIDPTINDLSFSTATGMLIHIAEQLSNNQYNRKGNNSKGENSIKRQFLNWFKNYF